MMYRKFTALLTIAGLCLSSAGCAMQPVSPAGKDAPAYAAYAAAIPEMPDIPRYPNEEDFTAGGKFDSEAFQTAVDAWGEFQNARSEAAGKYAGKLDAYIKKALPRLLMTEEPGENAVCSPVNIWLALAMLAETAGNDTKSEITQLLGAASQEELRETAAALYKATLNDDGTVSSLPAASVWLGKDVEYNEETVKALSEFHKASCFKGDMTDKGYSQAFREWLKANTAGLLDEAADGVEDFKPETVMTLATTMYFSAKWHCEFDNALTAKQTFHGAAADVEADFMHSSSDMPYARGEGFEAAGMQMDGAGTMWVILPEEGKTPAELLESGTAADFLLDPDKAEASTCKVNLALPKFDVSASKDLKESLKDLGIKRAFDPQEADFSPLSGIEGLYVSSASHDARVKVDEKGVEAAAMTVISVEAMAFTEYPAVDFTADRPFIFAICGTDGMPLFCGVANSVM